MADWDEAWCGAWYGREAWGCGRLGRGVGVRPLHGGAWCGRTVSETRPTAGVVRPQSCGGGAWHTWHSGEPPPLPCSSSPSLSNGSHWSPSSLRGARQRRGGVATERREDAGRARNTPGRRKRDGGRAGAGCGCGVHKHRQGPSNA